MTEGLQLSLHTRDTVNQACGVLMERLGISRDAALQQLLRQARERGSTLQQVCESILAGTPASGN